MGVKSTVDITRNKAMGRILYLLKTASDQKIADILEVLDGDETFSNYSIVKDNDSSDAGSLCMEDDND